jgi:hypothetical protein
MNKLRVTLFIGATILVSVAFCSNAQAQYSVFVSGVGDDANSCSRTAPCKTFQRAHNVVADGGEIVAMDTGDPQFALPLTITKSVTITGEGVFAGITLTSGNAVYINSATAVVVLRHLSFYGVGTALNGIDVANAAALHVENCIVQGFTGQGLLVEASVPASMKTFVKDTVMRNNGGNLIAAGKAVLENCRFEGSSTGLEVSLGTKVTLHNCVMAGNSSFGLYCHDAGSQAMVDGCQIFSNDIAGIRSQGTGEVRVSNSKITNNVRGLSRLTAGKILSRISNSVLTNTVEDNTPNGTFSGTYLAK